MNPIKSIKYRANRIWRERLNKLAETKLIDHNLFPINEIKEGDIFIVGYPKSGNTWLQNLVTSLLYCPDASYLPDRLCQEVVPDIYAKKYYKRYGEINFFKSHELPDPSYRKVIYLIRDGRDVILSYYHMNKVLGLAYSLEEMIKEGKGLSPCKWHVHIRLWKKNPFKAEMLFVKYEDLLVNPLEELKRICNFANIERSNETLLKVASTNTFIKMREREDKFGFDNTNWKPKSKNERFFRKGKMKGYLEEIDQNLQRFFRRRSDRRIKTI